MARDHSDAGRVHARGARRRGDRHARAARAARTRGLGRRCRAGRPLRQQLLEASSEGRPALVARRRGPAARSARGACAGATAGQQAPSAGAPGAHRQRGGWGRGRWRGGAAEGCGPAGATRAGQEHWEGDGGGRDRRSAGAHMRCRVHVGKGSAAARAVPSAGGVREAAVLWRPVRALCQVLRAPSRAGARVCARPALRAPRRLPPARSVSRAWGLPVRQAPARRPRRGAAAGRSCASRRRHGERPGTAEHGAGGMPWCCAM